MLQDNLPKYKRIKEIIIGRIKSGIYQNDIPMPSENDFIKEFQVSRDTILKALSALTAEKFIVRKRG
ncbi:MAG: GntR family transcriptional regulator, partial [Candidatus Izemoplasmatales bacterium]|nr:GntR family transcriptional regulator [Candidatus Izemoplasmatales bacterium]